MDFSVCTDEGNSRFNVYFIQRLTRITHILIRKQLPAQIITKITISVKVNIKASFLITLNISLPSGLAQSQQKN